jgi:flavin reductase (DIM6/NTAB) family NADH-FMN oxidoreductase RutF
MPSKPQFRRVSATADGRAVVTARGANGLPNGLTANAITSVSLDPPLVLVCVNVGADTHAAIEGSGRFAINVLPAEAESLARRFADHGRLDKFQGVGWRARSAASRPTAPCLGRLRGGQGVSRGDHRFRRARSAPMHSASRSFLSRRIRPRDR